MSAQKKRHGFYLGVIMYKYKPVKFYLFTLLSTWIFWFAAAIISRFDWGMAPAMALMVVGLCVPTVVAFIMVRTSKSDALKKDYKDKICGFFRINFKNVIASLVVFSLVIVVSILISLLFGESKEQFGLTGGFSFSIGGLPTLAVLFATALFEEMGWRGYSEDSIASYMSWFKESIIFGCLWAAWHAPLFFIEGTYQYEILHMNPWYMVNFFVSMMPIGFFLTWVYLGNHRSIFACSIVHFCVNFLQEQIALTQNTKCIETVVLFIVAGIIVAFNKDMFFEKRHVGNFLGE